MCVQKTDELPLIEYGNALGYMTSELKANMYISEMVRCGPKDYEDKLRNYVTRK